MPHSDSVSPFSEASENLNPAELAKFDSMARRWWDKKGEFRGLHDINPVRCGYVARRVKLDQKSLLDVGCGGGLLSEALAARGARVTGIDRSPTALTVAREHAKASGLAINYQSATAEAFSRQQAGRFDVVTCMELIEHVPRPESLVRACARLAVPGGAVFFATLNRTLAAYLLAIVVAEYLFGIVGRGTHSWRGFIKPAELAAWGQAAGLKPVDVSGLVYLPFVGYARVSGPPQINYLMYFTKPF